MARLSISSVLVACSIPADLNSLIQTNNIIMYNKENSCAIHFQKHKSFLNCCLKALVNVFWNDLYIIVMLMRLAITLRLSLPKQWIGEPAFIFHLQAKTHSYPLDLACPNSKTQAKHQLIQWICGSDLHSFYMYRWLSWLSYRHSLPQIPLHVHFITSVQQLSHRMDGQAQGFREREGEVGQCKRPMVFCKWSAGHVICPVT